MSAAAARRAAAVAIAAAGAIGAGRAEAHLMPAQQGTVNVVGAGVFMVLSVPASALHGADDDHDGRIDAAELTLHEAELRAEIDRRLAILDGTTPARTERVDLILSPQHDAVGGRADQIVVLKHATLAAPPRDLRVRCNLFGESAPERSITLTATRHPASGTETEVSVLTPEAPEHGFFMPAPALSPAILGRPGSGPGGLWTTGALLAAMLALVGWSRARKSITPAS